jgi:uncharacterized membrane protein
MTTIFLAFLIGVISGLRTFTPPAAVSWAARLGWLHLENTWLAFLGATITPYILSLLATWELIYDKLPKAQSRKSPASFAARIVSGAFCGAALGLSNQATLGGLAAGVAGAIAGTLGGYEARSRLAKTLGKDLPAALIEDVIAIAGAFFLVSRFS